MPDDIIEIFAEDIDTEQWQMLSEFTYAENIVRYLSSRDATASAPQLIEFIGGCVTQAHEYFSAAKTVTLNTSPLLYYYGVTNLLAGVCSLLKGQIPTIRGHGLDFEIPERRSRVADLIINIRWREAGAFRTFCEMLGTSTALEGGQSWTFLEILGSVPELISDFERCYPDEQPHVIPVEIVKLEESALDRVALSDVERFQDKEQMLARIENFSKSYLPPNQTETHLVMRYRLRGERIGVYSVSGQKFLPLAHVKGSYSITFPPILYCFLGLYALGFLSRYQPQVWTPFVRADTSGERDIIQRFIRTAARIVPNLALNMLHQSRLSFVTRPRGMVDLSAAITSKKVREIVRSEMRDR